MTTVGFGKLMLFLCFCCISINLKGIAAISKLSNNDERVLQCNEATSCNSFFFIDVEPPAVEYLFNYTATWVSGNRVTLTLAGGEKSCPTYWSNGFGVHERAEVNDGTCKSF